MSESNIPLGDPARYPATCIGVDGILTQPTHDKHEDEVAELEMAINMSLGLSNPDTTEDSSVDDTPIDMEEQTELEQALFLSSLPPEMFDEQLAQLLVAKNHSLLAADNFSESRKKVTELNAAAGQLIEYFQQSGDCAAIDNVVHLLEQAITLTPDGHPDKAALLNNLGCSFQNRFDRLGELGDLENAILVKRQAVDLTPDGHADKAARLNNLGNSFSRRFERLGELGDIENGILFNRQAVDLTPDGHADKATRLNNLGSAFQSRFNCLSDLGDIENAILVNQQAVDLTPDGHADKATWLNNLGNSFRSRFEHLGELGDIENAILINRQAVDLTPDGHAVKATLLNNLGSAFERRFVHLGELGDIENAIFVKRQAVDLTPDDHAGKAKRLSSLGNAFFRRFECLGELGDIENAILVNRQAVDLTPDGHADKATWLNNLGNSFRSRFERLGELGDIENAILINRQAADLTPDGHAVKATLLSNLGNAFFRRFERLGELGDIENAIVVNQQTVDLTPDGYADKAGMLNNLGNAFLSRFERLGELGDIENAILVYRRAADLTPDGHADKAARLNNLGNVFLSRFKRLADPSDRHHASSAFQNASLQSSGMASVQLRAAGLWANLCSDLHSALLAYERFFELIPRVIWLGQTVNRRYEELPLIGSVINAAVATAIFFGDLPRAVEWLEEGRNVVWGQILQLRSPLDDLHQQYPKTAKELKVVSWALEHAGISTERSFDNTGSETNPEEEAQKHRRLAVRYEELLMEVRSFDGFENFLKPKKISELAPTANNGPVVIVNVADSRCDALVLCSSGDIVHVPLPALSLLRVEELRLKLTSSLRAQNVRIDRNGDRQSRQRSRRKDNQDHFISVLADLWVDVVQPILSKIEDVLYENTRGPLPHITWCATGPLAFLPLHAAGIYRSDDQTKNINISDFVVSSYATTLTTMLSSHSKPKRDPTKTPSILIVSQPATPGLTFLPGTEEEAKAIQKYALPEGIHHLTREAATVETVKNEMSKYEFIHLACHGIQDLKDPLDSAFALYDGRLKLKALMGLSMENAELAVLSACQTATGDEKLPEEAVHLAAGMLAVGYPNVIATMWSIGDNDAPLIADKVYASLLGRYDNSESQKAKLTPAYALHEAVKHLRKEVGEKNFVKWVPFIHFGV